jgi:hypothetical protein
MTYREDAADAVLADESLASPAVCEYHTSDKLLVVSHYAYKRVLN